MQYEVVISATIVYTIMACSTQYEVVTSPSRAVQIHYNGADGSVLIFVGCMYETGVVLSLDKQVVRFYYCVCARIWHVLLMFDVCSMWS